jgi:hypothetical protein
MPFQLLDLHEQEVRELRRGLDLRLAELKKIRKACDEAGLSTHDAEWHMNIVQGTDDGPGILYQVQSQLDALYEGEEPQHGDQLEEPFPDPEGEGEQEEE